MTRSTVPDRPEVSAALLAHLRDEASASSDFVDVILDTPGIDGRYGGVDGRQMLIEIMHSLVVLTGSEKAAVAWIFNSGGFTTIAESDADLALENGDFWALTVMRDWLLVLETYRSSCPELIDAIFGRSDTPSLPLNRAAASRTS